MDETIPTCPFCNQAAKLVRRPARVRRGEQVLALELETWECPGSCAGPDGETPFRFVDRALGRRNDEAAKTAWLETLGEPMPDPRPPGRKPAEKRVVPVHIMLTPSEAAELDRLRGSRSRSEYLRDKAFHP